VRKREEVQDVLRSAIAVTPDKVENRDWAQEDSLHGRQVEVIHDGEDFGQQAEEQSGPDERDAERHSSDQPPQRFSVEVGEDPLRLPLLVRLRGDQAEAVLDRGTEVRWLWGFGRHGDTPVETRLLVPGYRSFDPANRAGDNR